MLLSNVININLLLISFLKHENFHIYYLFNIGDKTITDVCDHEGNFWNGWEKYEK